ncbi:over compensating males [Arctopsyche grandis]|uniref:over compensating males n=1 Tax=Arctopsyche grandis TaxID=121162 RepID=UPI00406D9741
MGENSAFVFSYHHPIYDLPEIVYNQNIEDLLILGDVIQPDPIVPNSQCAINQPKQPNKSRQSPIPKQNSKCSKRDRKSDCDVKKKNDKINNNHTNEKPVEISEISKENLESDIDDDSTSFEEILYRNENFISQFTKSGHKNTVLDNSIVNVLEKFVTEFSPLNRFSWKILQKLNISSHKFPEQYIKVDGCDILLSGNSGGNVRDVAFKSIVKLPKKFEERNTKGVVKTKLPTPTKNVTSKRKGLLTYMNIKLKPGPLCKKPKLNNFEPNTGLGEVELIKMPPVALEISPLIGSPLDANVCVNLKRVRNSQGFIDAPWANFASSTLDNKLPAKNASHTFIIPYENNQSRILMRRDLDMADCFWRKNSENEYKNRTSASDLDTRLDFLDNYEPKNPRDECVASVLSDILKAVCVEEFQDSICKYDPSDAPKTDESMLLDSKFVNKKKGVKRKYVNELKKLNVTVIDIGGDAMKENCNNDYCKLGCVCNSLNTNYFLNEHCGSPECMFDCKCNLEDDKKSSSNICSPEKSPKISQSAVLNLQHQVNRNLSKEEKKFHRTVIRSDDQTILVGAKRRGVKLPKRFEDYKGSFSKGKDVSPKEHQLSSEVKILLPKLPSFINGDPWCMVHQLYRCFCKGLLVEGVQFGFSTTHDDHECQSIVDSTLSFQRNVEIKVIADIPCSRTTYDPEILKRVVEKKVNYLNRNNDIRLSQSTVEDPSTLVTQINTSNTKVVDSEVNKVNENIDHSNMTNVKNVNEKQDPPVISIPNKTDFSKMCGIVCNNVDKLLNKNNCIIPPIENKFHAMSLSSIISNNCLQKIFIWLTIKPPYLQFITLKDSISCPHVCVNITLASKKLIDMHPPFLKEIVSYKITKDCHYLLLGKSYAWQIFGISEYQKSSSEGNQSLDGLENIISNDVNVFRPRLIPIVSKLQNIVPKINKKVQSNVQSGPSQQNSFPKVVKVRKDLLIKLIPPTTVKNNKYWLLILISKDFRGIRVNSKKFYSNIISIQVAISEAQKAKEFIRIPSKDTSESTEKVHFGLYAAPCQGENCVFLGPYGFNDAVDIEIDNHNPNGNQSRVSWLYPTNVKLYTILDTLSTQILKKYVCGTSNLNTILQSRERTALKQISTEESSSKAVDTDVNVLVDSTINNTRFTNLTDLAPSSTFQNSFMKTSRSGNSSLLSESFIKFSESFKRAEVEQQKTTDDEDDDVIILPSNDNEVLEISDSE